MEVTAPHLTHAMPMLVPLNSSVSAAPGGGDPRRPVRRRPAAPRRPHQPGHPAPAAPPLRDRGARAGAVAAAAPGCAARCSAGTASSRTTPGWSPPWPAPPRRTARTSAPAPGCSPPPAPRCRCATSSPARTATVTARTVINATGVWAGDLVDEITLRPSRGTHLVLREESVPGLQVAVFAPVPGETNRFVLVLPQPDGTLYVGLTDEPVDGPVPDVPEPTEPEIGFLLDVVSAAFARPLHRTDVVGAFAGLRPLLDVPTPTAPTRPPTSRAGTPCSRQRTGVVTIVGGKLTTYRRMAEDAVDAAVAHAGHRRRRVPHPRRCRCSAPPTAHALAGLEQPARLVRRFGTDAALVLDDRRARSPGSPSDELLAPDRRRHPGHPGRAGLRGHPRGRRRRRRPARPAHPGRAGPRRPGAAPYPPPSGPWRWPPRACNSVSVLLQAVDARQSSARSVTPRGGTDEFRPRPGRYPSGRLDRREERDP